LPPLFSDFYLAMLLLAIARDDGTLGFNKIKMCMVVVVMMMMMQGLGCTGTMPQREITTLEDKWRTSIRIQKVGQHQAT
jgi:hypothetical protein